MSLEKFVHQELVVVNEIAFIYMRVRSLSGRATVAAQHNKDELCD